MEKENYISIGKITNFFGIQGEAKVGFDNLAQFKNAKRVVLLDDSKKRELIIQKVRYQKNFAIVKFEGINDINSLLEFKGQKLYILKKEMLNNLEKDEFLICDLTGSIVYNEKGDKLGTVINVSNNGGQDLLNIKNLIGQIDLVPFVDEFFPYVDIKNKKIVIKPIEGLLS